VKDAVVYVFACPVGTPPPGTLSPKVFERLWLGPDFVREFAKALFSFHEFKDSRWGITLLQVQVVGFDGVREFWP
jgi:hypothetical protein